MSFPFRKVNWIRSDIELVYIDFQQEIRDRAAGKNRFGAMKSSNKNDRTLNLSIANESCKYCWPWQPTYSSVRMIYSMWPKEIWQTTQGGRNRVAEKKNKARKISTFIIALEHFMWHKQSFGHRACYVRSLCRYIVVFIDFRPEVIKVRIKTP